MLAAPPTGGWAGSCCTPATRSTPHLPASRLGQVGRPSPSSPARCLGSVRPVLTKPSFRPLAGGIVAAVVVATTAIACGGGGGGDGTETGSPPLADAQARAAIVNQLAARPEEQRGVVRFRFSVISEGRAQSMVQGVADYDQQRYLSRLEIDRPDVVATYDHAVIEGNTYEKLLKMQRPGSPKFEPRWSSPEPWSPDKNNLGVVPLLRVPYIGDYYFEFRGDAANLDESRRRSLLDAVLISVTRVGGETLRGASTVHYRLVFDRERAKEALKDELARSVFSFPEALDASDEADVWVDHQGRIRKYAHATSTTSRVEWEFWDYGNPDPVDVPDDLVVPRGGS